MREALLPPGAAPWRGIFNEQLAVPTAAFFHNFGGSTNSVVITGVDVTCLASALEAQLLVQFFDGSSGFISTAQIIEGALTPGPGSLSLQWRGAMPMIAGDQVLAGGSILGAGVGDFGCVAFGFWLPPLAGTIL